MAVDTVMRTQANSSVSSAGHFQIVQPRLNGMWTNNDKHPLLIPTGRFQSATSPGSVSVFLPGRHAIGTLSDHEPALELTTLPAQSSRRPRVYVLNECVRVRHRFKIDDVVQASAVHFGCGIWGLISSALLSTKESYTAVYNYGIFADAKREEQCCGCELLQRENHGIH